MVLVYRFTLSKQEHANWVIIGLIAFAWILTIVLGFICAVMLVLIPWSNYPSIASLIPDLSSMSANIASSLVLFFLFLASNIVAMILRYVINSYDKKHLLEEIRAQNGMRLEPVHDYYLSIPITPFLDEISRKFKTYPQEKINCQKRLVFQRITQFTKLLSKKLEAMDLDVVYASDFAETSDGQVQFPTTEDATKEFERKIHKHSNIKIEDSGCFVMFLPLPFKVSSSCLVEAGYAAKLGLYSIHIFHHLDVLPSILKYAKELEDKCFSDDRPDISTKFTKYILGEEDPTFDINKEVTEFAKYIEEARRQLVIKNSGD